MGVNQAEMPQRATAKPEAPGWPRLRQRLRAPRRLLVLRALKLGDMLCAIPALRAIRAAWPGTEIVLLGLPWARALLDHYPAYFDGFRNFPGYPGLPEQTPDVQGWERVRAALRRERFDLAIQMHGNGSVVNPLVAALGACRTAGFYPAGGPCPDPRTHLPWPTQGLEVHRLLGLCEFLGIPPCGDHLEWTVTPGDRSKLDALVQPRRLEPGRYVCLHPGASTPQRRWPLDCFAAVASDLASRGFTVVLTGTDDERELTSALARGFPGHGIDLAGRTDLAALGALVSGARLVVCNDTGVSHLAAAVKTPSVVLSTGANPERWAPPDCRRHRVLRREDGGGTRAALRQIDDLLAVKGFRFGGPPDRLHQRLARRLQCSRSGC